ncbi:MAG: hypothetical protein HC919_12795 [Oscillatoriales cyanobacterium SM2_2_1]|nr:hypothetical protein [Oscillatoriales cyanobacterium SM2_2_1]
MSLLSLGTLCADRYRLLELRQDSKPLTTYDAQDIHTESACVVSRWQPSCHEQYQSLYQTFAFAVPHWQQLGAHEETFPQILNFFEWDGAFWTVTAPIPGEWVQEAINRREFFPEPQVTAWFWQVLRGLRAAHGLGLVHGNINPATLLWTMGGGPGRLVLLYPLGLSGLSLGVPGYMPARQAESETDGDLYALAATTIHLLSHMHPSYVLDAEQHPRPWEIEANVNLNLAAILNRMVAAEPLERYPSAAAVLEAMEQTLGSVVTPLAPPQFTDRLMERVLPVASLLFSGALAITAVGAVVLGWQRFAPPPRVEQEPEPLVMQFAMQHRLVGHQQPVRSLAIFPNNFIVISGGGDRFLRFWNVAGKSFANLAVAGVGVQAIAIHPSGNSFVSGHQDHRLQVWSFRSARLRRTLSGHTGPITGLGYTNQGQWLVSSGDRTVRIWDWRRGQAIRTLTVPSAVTSLGIHPLDTMVVTGSQDGVIRLWDATTGKLDRELTGHGAAVTALVFSRDGTTLVSGSGDRTVRIWDVDTRQAVRTLTGYELPVRALAISGDNLILATGGDDSAIRLWDVRNGEPLQTLAGHTGPIFALAFAPDDLTLVSGSGDRTIKVWNVAPSVPSP